MKSRFSNIKNLKLTIMLIASVVILTGIGIYYSVTGKAKGKYGLSHPFIVSALLGEDDVEAIDMKAKKDPAKLPDIPSASSTDASATDASATDASSGDAAKADTASASDSTSSDAEEDNTPKDPAEYPGKMDRPMQYEDLPEFTARSPYYEYVDKKPLSTTYPYVKVDDDYFKDTLFLGDSRIEGLHDYGNIENADFAYMHGVSVFDVCDEWLNWGDKGGGDLNTLLTENQYKKIYIMLGVNELGKGFAVDYAEQYSNVLEYIRARQPKAIITVMSVMYVSKSYSDGSNVFNNDNIDCRNSYVTRYINGYDTFYLDVNPSVSTEDNDLNSEYTNDGLHLSASHYQLMVDYIKEHGLQDELWED